MGAFKNYVDQKGWVGGSPNVNCSNKPYLVKASTRGRWVVKKCFMLVNVALECPLT